MPVLRKKRTAAKPDLRPGSEPAASPFKADARCKCGRTFGEHTQQAIHEGSGTRTVFQNPEGHCPNFREVDD